MKRREEFLPILALCISTNPNDKQTSDLIHMLFSLFTSPTSHQRKLIIVCLIIISFIHTFFVRSFIHSFIHSFILSFFLSFFFSFFTSDLIHMLFSLFTSPTSHQRKLIIV